MTRRREPSSGVGGAGGSRRCTGIGVDRGDARCLPRRVHHEDLVPAHQPDLEDEQHEGDQQREHERQLDGGLTSLAHP